MKTLWKVGCAFIVTILVLLLFMAYHYRAEKYAIVYSTFLATTNQDVLGQPPALCYSNEELEQALKRLDVLGQSGIKRFNLDHTNLIACVIPNHTVEKVVGRGDFGLIVARKSSTDGISYTVLEGTKRFLEFNYPDDHTNMK